ncbi:hypothetical protein ACFX2G_002893 [Malus domestica]
MELQEEIDVKGFVPDSILYHYLIHSCVKNSYSNGVFKLFEELKETLGGAMEDGVVYGNLIKGYFMRGIEKDAM